MLRGTVVKIGGRVLNDAAWVDSLSTAIAGRKRPMLIVHGGGPEIDAVQRGLGAAPAWRDGLRVTTPAALRAASMVLSGVVNKRLVGALIGAGADAVGISGEDAALFQAEPSASGALGHTGDILRVRTRLLEVLVESGFLPVISPLSRGPDGGALNVNADDAASALAIAIGANELLFISDVPGVFHSEECLGALGECAVEGFVESGRASGGMTPKLRAAAAAASAGVASVRIGDIALLTDSAAGTRITPRRELAAV